jgi:class 3 adenylate cyclase
MQRTATELVGSSASLCPTILVIEDNRDLQELLKTQLSNFGANPIGKYTGRAGLEWLRENKADLVILDWMLPDTDGLAVTKAIRKTHSPSALPIVILSALGQFADRRVLGLEAGANDFIAKPYEVEELLARIYAQLQVKQETERKERLMSGYMTRAFRDRLDADPEFASRRELRQGVILFADLRGFTAMAAQNQIEGTVRVLDEFYDAMMQVVDTHGGYVIDIVGDELLAAFGIEDDLPDAAWHALKAAVAMQEKFAFLKFQWRAARLDIGLGIGIDQGEVVLGSVGGSNLKRYTVIGSTVNFAHRLVDIACDGEIMLSPDMYDAVRPIFKGLPVQPVPARIKGLEAVKKIYRIDVPLPCR